VREIDKTSRRIQAEANFNKRLATVKIVGARTRVEALTRASSDAGYRWALETRAI
jgi:hypothetical protein